MSVLEQYDGNLIAARTDAKARVSGVKVAVADVSTGPGGKIAVLFSRLNVIDHDGDVTLPGAFTPSEVLISQWQHASWQPGFLPIGKGTIREEPGRGGVFRGQMFVNASRVAHETFETLKALGPISEWSYGFQIAESDVGLFGGRRVRFLRKLIVSEISPVLKGAGIGTGIIDMSSRDPAQLAFARVARENARALAALGGWVAAKRTIVGLAPDGQPVYAGRVGGRK